VTDIHIPSFDLTQQGWLPVTLSDPKSPPESWGLREFFARAHEVQGLNESSPLTYTAVLRMLLAVAHRALAGPESPTEWVTLWSRKSFDPSVFDAYLDRWQDRFDLFDPEKPFAQVPRMSSDRFSPAARLYMERSSGNNNLHFDHSTDTQTPPIDAGEAARALLTAQAYAFAGTGGMFMQSPMVAGYSVTFEGSNMFETLMLNLVWYDESHPTTLTASGDSPWWELEDLSIPNKGFARPRGLTDLYTWRSRRIHLVPEPDGTVQKVQYEQGWVVKDDSLDLRDPFKRYVESKGSSGKTASFPTNFTKGKALWRDSYGLIEGANRTAGVESTQTNEPPGILTNLSTIENAEEGVLERLLPNIVATGLVNNQARIDLWRMDRMRLPLRLLVAEEIQLAVHDAIAAAESGARILGMVGKRFCEVALSGDADDVSQIQNQLQLRERFWARLDRDFQGFMGKLGDDKPDLEAVLGEWIDLIKTLIRSVFVLATNTVTGHRWYEAQVRVAWMLDNLVKKQWPAQDRVSA